MSPGPTVVVGFGLTGRAVARVLSARGHEIVVIDDHPPLDAGGARDRIEVRPIPTGAALAALVASADVIVPSPGVAVSHPVLATAVDLGVTVQSELELAGALLAARSGPRPTLAAVTGTNGKTTVTTLATAMLVASGVQAVAAGNIGRPLIELVDADVEVIVAEVSSFQLQFTARFRPRISCWLNLSPDHLDWHPSLEHYRRAKARVWAAQGAGDTAVVNLDDAAVAAEADAGLAPEVRRVGFSVRGPAPFCRRGDQLIDPDGEVLVELAALPRTLPHDLANDLAAAAVALAAGGQRPGVGRALADQPLLAHRVALVAEADGVGYYDDSKATTPASVLAAVAGFSSVVLIAGGRNKGLDLGVLADTAPPVRAAVAIGDAAGEVEAALAPRVPVVRAATMADAVSQAVAQARPGDAVILSPGCASFDWYSSYGERGDDFAACVRRALGVATPNDHGAGRGGLLDEHRSPQRGDSR